MQRRAFIKKTGLFAIGISVFGNIHGNSDRFLSSTATTTDILGPYYRPGAPVKTNTNPAGYTGKLFHLHGTIFKEDGETLFRIAW
jgi:hypothetical protein